SVDAVMVGEDLGADYVVEGGVRRAEGHLRVTARVLDAKDGTNVWSETYDRDLTAANLFAVQDEITDGIVNSIGAFSGAILQAETDRTRQHAPEGLSGVECIYRHADYYATQPTPERHLAIRACYEQALESEPDNAMIYAGMAWNIRDELIFGFNPGADPLDRALASARRAVELDRDSPIAHWISALVHFNRGEIDEFRVSSDRAIALSPHHAALLADIGTQLGMSGDEDRGAAMIEKAIVMNPDHQPWYHYFLSYYYIFQEDYDTALTHAHGLTWGWWWDYVLRTTIYARTGRMGDARAEAARLLEAYPTYPEDARAEFEKWNLPEARIESYISTLRKVGIEIPEKDFPSN
ncbi:MAG: hypothetical protein QGF53_03665, partial [Alphaproteobacteria bacterium]|nr:hypothetical protein [Alphaproteobacteria bacterium]